MTDMAMNDEIERPLTVEELIDKLRYMVDSGALDGSEPVLTEQDWGLIAVDEARVEHQHETVVVSRPALRLPSLPSRPSRRLAYGGPGIGGEPRRVVVL